jgi:hypothetical protein
MLDEHSLTLRQLDQTRCDLYALQDELEFLKIQLARLPTRKDLARMALAIMVSTAGLVLFGIEVLSR